MEKLLYPGRKIWVVHEPVDRPKHDGTGEMWHDPGTIFDTQIVSFRKFLPRGPFNSVLHGPGERKQSLVQLYTDPGGVRTLAVADIRLKDPRGRR